MRLVFDACALIAFLRGEAGADLVEDLLTAEGNLCMAHAINLCEVFYDFLRASDESTALEALDDLDTIDLLTRDDMSRPFWTQVGRYKATRRLSLADCFAVALANQEDAVLVTTDHNEFDPIAQDGVCRVLFIR